MGIDAVIAIVFFLFWVGLAVGLFAGYFWLRKQERDTRLQEETGLQPHLEVFGAGRINRRQWSNAKGCRISVYDTFLVISVSSQRRRIPLYLIRGMEITDDDRELIITGLAEDESSLAIGFRGPDVPRLAIYLREHCRGLKVADTV